jgi:hypothetical protein
MRCTALGLLLPLILAACGIAEETKGPATPTAVTSAELPVAKESPRAVRAKAAVATADSDACTAYADCIDSAPASDPDEGGMHASSSTIRGWDKSAEQLRQCAVAHDLARAGGLCR